MHMPLLIEITLSSTTESHFSGITFFAWIAVSPQSATASSVETVRGVRVQVVASPHDVPRAVKGRFDEECEKFVITFRYLDEERSSYVLESSSDEIVHVYKGTSSGRVERIEVDVKKANANTVSLNILPTEICDRVERTLDRLRTHNLTLSTKLNYRAVSEALEESRSQLCTV